MVFNEEENELREFDHSNNTLDQGNLLRGIDNKTFTLYNDILLIARNLLETRKNIKILTHPFYPIKGIPIRK